MLRYIKKGEKKTTTDIFMMQWVSFGPKQPMGCTRTQSKTIYILGSELQYVYQIIIYNWDQKTL